MTRRHPDARHPWMRAVRAPLGIAILLTGGWLVGRAHGQNDWQYPDPYFGILEIEKSHDAGTWRRYRAEVSPAPKRDAGAAAGRAADQIPGQRPSPRARWRTRTRR